MKRWRMVKKCCALFLCCALLMGILPQAGWAANDDEVRYYCDAEGVRHEVKEPVMVIEEGVSAWNVEDGGAWYVVERDVTLTERVEVTGAVSLLLCDGVTLTVEKGVHVAGENALTVYGQEAGSGTLTGFSTVPEDSAGIGGNENERYGTILINGGIIETFGGAYGAGIGGGSRSIDGKIIVNGNASLIARGGKFGGAGIGGGWTGSVGTIIINDCKYISARGNQGAGIGSGFSSAKNGNEGYIIINDGYIDAFGLNGAAGIGGGVSSDGCFIIITNGVITAHGESGGAGIGAGRGSYLGGNISIIGGYIEAKGSSFGEYGAAGIGGGNKGGSGTISISGATVCAIGGEGTVKGGQAIGNGGGYTGDVENITITDEQGYPLIEATADDNVEQVIAGSTESWRGIVFENGVGCVYGDLTLVADLEVAEGQTLEIPADVTLTVPEDVTLTNNGDIIGSGTIMGTVQGKPPQESVVVDDGKVVITAEVSPSESGTTVPSAGTYAKGDAVTLVAEPAEGYHFVSWQEEGQTFGEDATYTFTADIDRHLCAVFAPHKWQDGVCTGCGAVCTHSGGAATCEERAVCERCGERYGNLAAHILQYQPRVEPTYNATGTMAHYACSVCAVCFLDADASQPVAPADLVIPRKEWPQPEPERGTVVFEAMIHGSATVSPEKPCVGAVVTVCAEPERGYVTESVRAIDDTGELLAVKQHADGRYTFVQPRGEVRVQIVFAPMPLPFADVAAGDWFYTPVHDVFVRGLMTGVDADTFAPQIPATRAMVVSVLARLSTVPQSGARMSMTDVQEGDWYADAVAWALETGVAHGFEDGSFRPNEAISREQLVAMFYNFALLEGAAMTEKGDLSLYADAARISPWAHDALSWAVGADFLQGTAQHLLQPQGLATRAQLATLLMRYEEELAKNA